MFAASLTSGRSLWTHLGRWSHLALRLGRRHYLSAISAIALGGALVLAVTSTGFEQQPQASSAQPVARYDTSAPSATPGIAASSTPLIASVTTRVLVYYIVDSPEQQQRIEAALQSDANSQAQRGVEVQMTPTEREFFIVRDAVDAAEKLQMLRETEVIAPSLGYTLEIVDMRW